jgi:phosphatidylserine/phosphatidylglycerophosphate/cardiolipin synthase-like enzyme
VDDSTAPRQHNRMSHRFLMLAALAVPPGFVPVGIAAAAEWSVCFTPAENCEARIVATIANAKQTIRVQAFSFTSRPIAAALIGAARRGVDVRLIVGRSRGGSDANSRVGEVAAQGVQVLIDEPPGLMHDKIVIVDGETVLTGSFNFSRSAQTRNVENVLIVNENAVARRYEDNWRDRAAVSWPYEARAEGSRPPGRARAPEAAQPDISGDEAGRR